MTKRKAAETVRNYLAARDAGKAAYALSDELLQELITHLEPGESVDLGGGQTATLVDQFATKMKVWKPCGVSRFDVRISNG